MLDPTAEEIQHAKKQRERIYNDNIYFTLKSVSEGIPEWAYNLRKFVYETDNGEIGGENEAELIWVKIMKIFKVKKVKNMANFSVKKMTNFSYRISTKIR